MSDIINQLWAWASILSSDPRFAAAFAAFVVSWNIGNRNTAFACAVIAFCTIRLIIWLSSIPLDGAIEIPVEGASGVGAAMAFWGVHGMRERFNNLRLPEIIRDFMGGGRK